MGIDYINTDQIAALGFFCINGKRVNIRIQRPTRCINPPIVVMTVAVGSRM